MKNAESTLYTMFVLAPLAAAFTLHAPSVPTRRVGAITMEAARNAADEALLLRLCALTDRGQRASPGQMAELRNIVARLELNAPAADATDLNGEWSLLAACGESCYRSSPFFWAFRQATASYTTPIAIPNPNVPAGGPLASAVLAITDAIPFYDIGSVRQTISGLCAEETGCEVSDDDESDVSADAEPSDGSSFNLNVPAEGAFVSEVELVIGRNFGFPAAQSLMTTTCTAQEKTPGTWMALPGAPSGPNVVNVELRVETTAAKQSSIAALLPGLDEMLKFPTGDALDAASSQSSRVQVATTYLSESGLRISRPVLDLGGQQGLMGEEESMPIFVYARV